MPGPLLARLAQEARQARLKAGLRQIDIATTAGVAHTTVSAFELGRSWPQAPERLIDAYATETGVPAGRLWRAAVREAFR